MKTKLITCVAVVSFFCANYLPGQQLSSYVNKYVNFSKNFPQEKVYLHFDNTSYFLGETIWFKAYVTRADRNALSNMSKVLYVELLNSQGNILESKKLKIEDGQCHGEFDLLKYNYGGYYEVRAYTRYMLNFGNDNYFSRVFAVCDEPVDEKYKPTITERPYSQRIPQVRKELTSDKFEMNFYPEGGNLVKGLTSVVAFKAISNKGIGTDVTGEIYNEKKELISTFSTAYNGSGMFSLCPDSGKYTVKVVFQNKEYKFPIPEVLRQGYVINVNAYNKEKINISIQKSDNAPKDSIGLAISCRGALYAFKKIGWTNDENTVYLSFPRKICCLRVFRR
ncbi:MAG: hypothetical protein QM751_15725 [Paludibacteraceae bacterium]